MVLKYGALQDRGVLNLQDPRGTRKNPVCYVSAGRKCSWEERCQGEAAPWATASWLWDGEEACAVERREAWTEEWSLNRREREGQK